ncbi:MAG: thioredoxin domain-containing protein, partial [Pseudomonadota bacterium]|nr:thioredoxin domain-containing protein [Pseudomonadota bacterium]
GGTYFPPQPRYGMPAFADLLKKVAEFYHQHYEQIAKQNQTLAQAFAQIQTSVSKQVPLIEAQPLNLARQEIEHSFDSSWGGFGEAPKFPHLPHVERLLHHALRTQQQGEFDEQGLEMALLTLRKMALGGIYDQLGGGFYRYSVDKFWMIPHFEKMLYDNGPFLALYSEAWQLTKAPLFKRVALETAQWVLREMQAPEGGFYSTLDADSEGEEGKFYLWSKEQFKSTLNDSLYPLLAYYFGLNRPANFEGRWHLYSYHDCSHVAQHYQLPVSEVETYLDQARQLLFQSRATRVPPGRDEKILTSWNALMIKGMAVCGRILARPELLKAAEKALDFIEKTLWHNGQLLATYKEGKAHLNAYLDDYAYLLDAILTLLQARWRDSDLKLACALAEKLLHSFADTQHGGFYFTAHDHEALIARPKPFADESIPAGNGVAAVALGRLGHLLGEPRYLEAAKATLEAAWSSISELPSAHNTLLLALEDYLFPPQMIILRGEENELSTWQAQCQQDYAPQRFCVAIPAFAQALPGRLAECQPQGRIVAYVCHGYHCQPPITRLEALSEVLTQSAQLHYPLLTAAC